MTNKKVWIGLAIIVVAIVLLIVFKPFQDNSPGEYNEFAQCLTEAGVKMYGTEWCQHCKAQKALFGKKSFKFVDYIDCDRDELKCAVAGVPGYPTWIFSDGSKESGTQSLETLSLKTGCPIVPEVDTNSTVE